MNGAAPKIEIFKPFGEAFELTKKILFQPFDLKKWCVIGFAAFLCGHYSAGGFGFNPGPGNFSANRAHRGFVPPDFSQFQPWVGVALGVAFLLILALILVLTWLRARGNFIFVDCIARNRAAIAAPWREYRQEGNSYFWFSLAIVLVALLFVGLIIVIFFPMAWMNYQPHGSSTAVLIIVAILVFLGWMLFAVTFALISFFMVPVMYIRRCRALDAFRDVARLVVHHIGVFLLFVLFSIVLFLGLIMASTLVTCATCCMAALPYVGTVIMLPAFVCLRAFGLLFIRQFGPGYDVWAGAVPLPAGTTPFPPAPPIPPPIQT